MNLTVALMELTPSTAETFITQACQEGAETIDLSDCTFADIGGIVRLVLLVRHLASRQHPVQLIIPKDEDVQSYLERANAFQEMRGLCQLDQSVEHLRYHGRYPTKKLVEIRPLEVEGQVRAIAECFSAALKAHRNVSTQIIDAVERILYETLQNIPEHADPHRTLGVHNGLAALQRYSSRLCVSVGDLGIGIRESLTDNPQFPPDKYDHARAIEAAITGASRHGDCGRGGGLMSVMSAVKNLGGSLSIRSGNAIVRVDDLFGQLAEACAPFPGTQVDIVVPLSGRG